MSLALHELLVCCRGLENDKATERKKEVEKFRQLIRSADTVEQLDQNSESRHSKHSKQLNWDAVFRFLQRFIRKETECLQSGKANVSTTTQANRQKKMQEISSLIKYFIRCANKNHSRSSLSGGPRLKCMELLSHIMEVLRDSYSCNAYGADYSSILLKDILSVRKYWCEITQQQWTDLLDLYCGLYLKASKDIDRVLLARILHTLVRGSCLQTEGLTHSLFEFFSKALPNARHEKILAVLEHMLAALNVFLKASAMNCRVRVCKLGEDLLPTVLYIWTQKRPQDLLKDEIIQFFCLQLRVHHPKGAKTQETGAYAEDWSKWQSLLYNLYDALVSEINQIGSRGKYSTGSRHVAVKENLIELTADICHQLFTQDTRVLEITQSHMCGTQRGTQQGTPSKRRRIQLGWEVIRDNLQRSQSDFDLIPWLQITAVLVWKYPSILPSAELVPLLTALHQLLVQQRRGEKTPYVVRCLSNIAACQSGKKDLRLSQKPELQKLWTRLWAVTLRYVSSQQIETEAFGLLEAVIQGGLIPVDREFWKIFTGSACKPSFAAAQCLARALTKCAVPERLETGLEYMAAIEGNGPPSLREAILRWILLHQMDEDTEESTKPHPIVCRDFPNHIVPRILVTLTLKDSRAGMDFLTFPLASESILQKDLLLAEGDGVSLEIENLYLQSTFDEMPSCSSNEVNAPVRNSAAPSVTVKQGVKERLEQYLLAVSEHLLNSYSLDSQTLPECLVRCIGLFTGVLGCSVHAGILTEEDACKTVLFQKAKNSASLISSNLVLRLLPSRLLNELADICKLLNGSLSEELRDEQLNRKATLLKMIAVVLCCSPVCAKSVLAEEHLSKQDLAFLDTLKFLCLCASSELIHGLPFKPADIRRKLLQLINLADCTKPLHLHMLSRLFQEVVPHRSGKLKMLPLKLQLQAFENVYLKAQDGMRFKNGSLSEELRDEQLNRKATLLKMIAVVLCCSPVCVFTCVVLQQIDNLIHNNLPEIVVELLMTVYESANQEAGEGADLVNFVGELDPAPNPPHFPSYVIKATLDYISKCHSTNFKSLVAILSKNPTAVEFCGDALEKHMQVIVGTLTGLVSEQPEIQQQVLSLLRFLVIDNKDNENLYKAIKLLEPFPDRPAFRELRAAQQRIKYSKGTFTLLECVGEAGYEPATALQSSKAAGSCLGEIGPVDFSTIALLHKRDQLNSRALELFQEKEFQWIYVILKSINNALTDHSIEVRSAAATCLKSILATRSGIQFWEKHKDNNDPMLFYFNPFRSAKKKLPQGPVEEPMPDPTEILDNVDLWVPQNGCHDTWLKTLTCALLDSGGVKCEALLLLGPLCQVKTDFCRTVLPYLIHDILLHDADSSWRALLSRHIQGFFTSCSKAVSVSSRSATPAIVDSESESLTHGQLDKTSLRTMLAVLDYLRRQKRPIQGNLRGQDQIRQRREQKVLQQKGGGGGAMKLNGGFCYFIFYIFSLLFPFTTSRAAAKTSRRIVFEDTNQNFTIASLSDKSKEETGISLQDLLIEVYRSIGEPDSLYGCGGGTILHPLTRIRTYEHEAMWGRALISYDLHTTLSPVARQAGIIQALQNFGLCNTLVTYLKGLECETAEWGAELQEIRYQAAWRNTQWDCVPSVRDESTGPGYHESVYCALQSLRDKEFSAFHESLRYARVCEVEELCRESLESVYSLYPTLCKLQGISELESIGQLLTGAVTDNALGLVYSNWQQQSQLLKDSDFSFQEPILALRTVIQETLLQQEAEDTRKEYLRSVLTQHLMELSKVALTAGNTQLAERAVFQMKQHSTVGYGVSPWQLEEAQVFWAKREEGLALGILRQMIEKLSDEAVSPLGVKSDEGYICVVPWLVDFEPGLAPMFAECLRLCGNWLAETRLESPGIILEKYLEKVLVLDPVFQSQNIPCKSQLQLSSTDVSQQRVNLGYEPF
ncbi:UNVERIFIED_CONTAM: hypothetical protein FKN15_067189 [Acipenser sinensis]